MKTNSKIAIALGAIAMMAGITIGCSKTDETQSISLSNETKQVYVIPDGLYFAQEKIKNGEVLTIVDKIENGISVKSTVINSKGEATSIPDAERIYGSYCEKDAYDVFEREFENYDCLKIIVETQNGFPNPGVHHYYVIYAGSYDEKGDCWYD